MGVSTNSIYTRFKDKEGLFSTIVKETADGLMDIYLESIQKATYSRDLNQANYEGEEGTDFVLDYIYQHFTEFKLIFCCSTGSQYEHSLFMYFAGEDGKRCMNLLHMIVLIKKLNHL